MFPLKILCKQFSSQVLLAKWEKMILLFVLLTKALFCKALHWANTGYRLIKRQCHASVIFLCKNTKNMYNYHKTIHPLIEFFFSIWLIHDIKKDKWHRDRLTLTGAEPVSAGPEVGLVTWATPQPSSDRIAAPVGNAPEFLESHSLPHSQTQFALWNLTTSGTFLKIEIISKF